MSAVITPEQMVRLELVTALRVANPVTSARTIHRVTEEHMDYILNGTVDPQSTGSGEVDRG